MFLSDTLAQAITDIGMRDVFDLEECRIAGDVHASGAYKGAAV